MKGWIKDADPWLAMGAGLYWASYAFRIMNAEPVYVAAVGPWSTVLEDVFMTIWVVVAFLACRRFGIRRARGPLCVAMICSSLAVLACDVVLPDLPLGASVTLMCVDFYTLGASMVLWGLAFASLEKHLAARSVVFSVLVASVVTVAGQALSAFVPIPWMTDVCCAGASAVMLGGRVTLIRRTHRRVQSRPRAMIAGLVVQRAAYGCALGFFPSAVGAYAEFGLDPVLLAATIAILATMPVAMTRLDVPSYTVLPALVLAACVALLLPFARNGIHAQLLSLVSGVWLAWQTLSSVQLSDLKERLGVDELVITFADKLAIAVTILSGAAAYRLAQIAGNGAVPSEAGAQTMLLIAFSVLVLTSMFSLAQLVVACQ